MNARTYPPLLPDPAFYRAVFVTPLLLVELTTLSLLTLSPMVRVRKSTFFCFALMIGVFGIWALSGFGYPQSALPITMNVVSKILAFITALAPLARQVTGLDPIPAMLAHRRAVAPHARFVIGQAERLPFAAGTFDLITAAGSLNYADLSSALTEIARVLTWDGTFLLYDFSVDQRSASGDEQAGWFRVVRATVPMAAWLAAV